MHARFLFIPLLFSVPLHAGNVATEPHLLPAKEVPAPAAKRPALPMESWTYGELLEKAKTGDFQANMQAGEYWMGLYYLNREDQPLACLLHMQQFFREAARSGHPAPKLMMTDPYGIFGIFKKDPLQPIHAAWLEECRKLAERGDMNAVTALYTVTDLSPEELKRYLAPLQKQAAAGNADALARLAVIRTDWMEEQPGKVLEWLQQQKPSVRQHPSVQAQAGHLALLMYQAAPAGDASREVWEKLAMQALTAAAAEGDAPSMRLLTAMKNGLDDRQRAELVQTLCNRGDLHTLLKVIASLMDGRQPAEGDLALLKQLLDKAQTLESNEAYARGAQLLSQDPKLTIFVNRQPSRTTASGVAEKLRKTVLTLLELRDERAMPFLKEPLAFSKKQVNLLPPYAKTHKELELASQMGDMDACVQLGELWKDEGSKTMDSVGKMHEARENMRIWYTQAAEGGHPLAALRLAQMDTPGLMDRSDAEPAKGLLDACIAKAATGDFITLKGIAEYLSQEQWETLLAPLRLKARTGDVLSQADLAYLLLFSYRSEEAGYPEGLAWARLSAGQGHPCGMYALGRALIYEFGLEKRMAEGDSWMFQAALLGHADAADTWNSNNENLQSYSAMLHGMADRGHIPSLLFLANQTAYPESHDDHAGESPAKPGTGKPATVTIEGEEMDAGAVPPWMTESGRERTAPAPQAVNPEAVQFWEQAAMLGSFTALDELAHYYETVAGSTADQAARQQILAQAMTAATLLVKKEDVRGFKRMAKYYEQGLGVQQNKELCRDYILKAAATSDPEALVEKARLLIKGEGMTPNPGAALEILKKLEEDQSQTAPGLYFLLGYLHEEGLGTPRDTALAYQFYVKGAEQDDSKAMNNLGSMYERGTGVAKNLDEAHKWYLQAASLGNDDARANAARVLEKKNKHSDA